MANAELKIPGEALMAVFWYGFHMGGRLALESAGTDKATAREVIDTLAETIATNEKHAATTKRGVERAVFLAVDL